MSGRMTALNRLNSGVASNSSRVRPPARLGLAALYARPSAIDALGDFLADYLLIGQPATYDIPHDGDETLRVRHLPHVQSAILLLSQPAAPPITGEC